MRMSHGFLAGLFVLGGVAMPSMRVEPAMGPVNYGTAGYRATIDPTTGTFVEPQASSGQGKVDVNHPLSRSSVGLVERDNLIGGGKMVDLQGRFQNTFVAAVDAEGKMTIECEPSTGEQNDGEDRQ